MVYYEGHIFKSRDEVMDFIQESATKYDIIDFMSEGLSVGDFYNAYENAMKTSNPQRTFWNWMTNIIDDTMCEYVDYEMDDCYDDEDMEEEEND